MLSISIKSFSMRLWEKISALKEGFFAIVIQPMFYFIYSDWLLHINNVRAGRTDEKFMIGLIFRTVKLIFVLWLLAKMTVFGFIYFDIFAIIKGTALNNIFFIKLFISSIILHIAFELFSKSYDKKIKSVLRFVVSLFSLDILNLHEKAQVVSLRTSIDQFIDNTVILNNLLKEHNNQQTEFSEVAQKLISNSINMFSAILYGETSSNSKNPFDRYVFELRAAFNATETFVISLFMLPLIFESSMVDNMTGVFEISLVNVCSFVIFAVIAYGFGKYIWDMALSKYRMDSISQESLLQNISIFKKYLQNKQIDSNVATDSVDFSEREEQWVVITKKYFFFWVSISQIFVILYLCFQRLNDPILQYLIFPETNSLFNLVVIDWLSWPFVLLTVVIIYTVLFLFHHKCLNYHQTTKWQDSLNIINLNILLLFLFFAFTTNDLLFFYFMFESTLIPMFFLLGFFGGRTRKIRAAYSFFLYTMLGSVALLIAIFQLILTYKTSEISLLTQFSGSDEIPNYVWWCLFWGFGVKVPIMPFHNWLAEAHVEAPTVGSVILAALLLKLGGYGMIRVLFLMLPTLSSINAPYAIAINTLSFFYASCMALRQFDFKRIIAYSSIAHMNFALIGLFSFNIEAVQGAIFLMVAHGLVSAGLFIGVGLLYELIATRLIITFGGLKRVWPVTAFLFLLFILANFGFPLTPNFVGELLIIIGGAHQILTVITLVTVGTILTLVYSLVLYSKMFLGSLRPHIKMWSYYIWNTQFDVSHTNQTITVLNYNIVLRFLLGLCVITGLYPSILLDLTNDYVVWNLIQKYYFI